VGLKRPRISVRIEGPPRARTKVFREKSNEELQPGGAIDAGNKKIQGLKTKVVGQHKKNCRSGDVRSVNFEA